MASQEEAATPSRDKPHSISARRKDEVASDSRAELPRAFCVPVGFYYLLTSNYTDATLSQNIPLLLEMNIINLLLHSRSLITENRYSRFISFLTIFLYWLQSAAWWRSVAT